MDIETLRDLVLSKRISTIKGGSTLKKKMDRPMDPYSKNGSLTDPPIQKMDPLVVSSNNKNV